MVNVQADLAGGILAKEAREAGIVYSMAYGINLLSPSSSLSGRVRPGSMLLQPAKAPSICRSITTLLPTPFGITMA